MNASLVFICLVLAVAAIEAVPGMRGNGASGGADADRDKANFAPRQIAIARANATGNNAKTSTFTEQREGFSGSSASASNTGGGPVFASSSARG